MSYFTQDFLDFFDELSDNNSKDWFHNNKKRYEKYVKIPFKEFVDEVITRIQLVESELAITAKDAIFRINRDIRFSKDKTPYKTHVGASIVNGKRAAHNIPGYYIHLDKDKVMIGGGLYRLDKTGLQKIREHISNNLSEFKKLISEPEFIQKYGELKGEKNKRIPKEFQDVLKEEPLIANKSLYYMVDLDRELILNPDFINIIMDYIQTGRKLNLFLSRAFR